MAQLLMFVGMMTHFELADAETVTVPFRGFPLVTTGYTVCDARVPTITLARRARAIDATLVHELAHAQDCLDDGDINGSPLAPGAHLENAIEHCMVNLAEYYACWVTEQAFGPHYDGH